MTFSAKSPPSKFGRTKCMGTESLGMNLSGNLPTTTCVETPFSWLRSAPAAPFTKRTTAVVRPGTTEPLQLSPPRGTMKIRAALFFLRAAWKQMKAGINTRACISVARPLPGSCFSETTKQSCGCAKGCRRLSREMVLGRFTLGSWLLGVAQSAGTICGRNSQATALAALLLRVNISLACAPGPGGVCKRTEALQLWDMRRFDHGEVSDANAVRKRALD
ncbi:hypothetical protein BU23DRAFT_604285 [Bimuria novae-zelandiae CBS 107.79]|uniref:Uncharacterized protein n=1 Tax=Bimuria novae-zelandiae CBS 107.79 TaxID=1447943 RepID=A0A6A5UKR2_9PLEO|nr:hypothetical protein BU23DRAFT_604285 [Bimuria novae-zelandiae CBS 107.79]